MKTLEKQLQQKKESDPIMTGILEEVRCILLLMLTCSRVHFFIGDIVDAQTIEATIQTWSDFFFFSNYYYWLEHYVELISYLKNNSGLPLTF